MPVLRLIFALALLLIPGIACAQTPGWIFPTTGSYGPLAADNGKILATDNVSGANLTVTLPTAASVGAGWQIGFSEGGGHGLFINAPVGVFLLAGQKSNTSLTVPSNTNYEHLVIQSDGTNFRVTNATYKTALFNGLDPPNSIGWTFLNTTGYSATFADNGNILSASQAPGPVTITLPSTGTIPNGWRIQLYPSGANSITLVRNGVAGGTLVDPTRTAQTSYTIPFGYAVVEFDGAAFRVVDWNGTIAGNFTTAPTVDSAAFTVLSAPGIPTANFIWQAIICPTTCSSFTSDTIRAVTQINPGSSEVAFGIASWMVNNNPAGFSGLGQGAAVTAYAISNVNGAQTWGFNGILSDIEFSSSPPATGVRGLYNEFDHYITSTLTQGAGLALGGTFLAQANVSGFALFTPWGASLSGPSAPFAKYMIGFVSNNGAAQIGLALGTANYTKTAGDGSQPIYLNYVDAAANYQNVGLAAFGGSLFIGGTSAWGIVLPDGSLNPNGIQLGALTNGLGAGGASLGPPGPPNTGSQGLLLHYFNSAGSSENYFMNIDNTGTLVITGTEAASSNIRYRFTGGIVKFPNIVTGTPVSYACFTSSNQLIKSATPC